MSLDAVKVEKRKESVYLNYPLINFTLTWRWDWLNEITKHRLVDKTSKAQIEKDRVHTYEKHFAVDDIEICK